MEPAAPDYRSAFQHAPIGLVLSAQRQIVDCNDRVLQMFGATREQLVGQSFVVMYPSTAEFERTGARIVASLDAQG
ncbi:MAG: PAS domain-containing protein, partial [Burkholderiales bacterium]